MKFVSWTQKVRTKHMLLYHDSLNWTDVEQDYKILPKNSNSLVPNASNQKH